MDIKKYLKALPAVAALLLTASCSNSDNEIVEAPQPAQTRIVPFTANVSSGNMTRATLNGSYYTFQTDDKLYVWTDNKKVHGVLSWVKPDDENYSNGTTYGGIFSGTLTIEEGGSLVDGSTTLNAVIKSDKDEILDEIGPFLANGGAPTYTNTITTSIEEAVQRYSYFKTYATYNSGGNTNFSFNGEQNSSFLSFDITLEDGTAAGADVSVNIYNGLSDPVRTGSVTTVNESGAIHAKFVAGFPTGISGTTLSSATVKLGDRDAISFGGTTSLAANKVYNVTKTYTTYKITASGTIAGQPFSKTKENIKEQTTLGEILGTKFSSITSLSSSGTSIVFGTLTPAEWQNTTVTVKGTGDTTITVSGTEGVSGYNIPVSDLVVTLTVAKMSD